MLLGDIIIAATDTVNTDVINLKDDSYQCDFTDYPYQVHSTYYKYFSNADYFSVRTLAKIELNKLAIHFFHFC